MTHSYKINDKLESHTASYTVALDAGTDYATQVGLIISLFALVEGYVPYALEKMIGIKRADARSIAGVFRAFSNKIDLLHQLNRNQGKIERVVFSHYKGLFSEANKIRNKYAHATYSYARTHFKLQTYSGDYNRSPEIIDGTLADFVSDATTLRRIINDLHGFYVRNEIPRTLDEQLRKLFP